MELEQAYKVWADTAEWAIERLTDSQIWRHGSRGLMPHCVWKLVLDARAPELDFQDLVRALKPIRDLGTKVPSTPPGNAEGALQASKSLVTFLKKQ